MGDLKFLLAEEIVARGGPCVFSEVESIAVEWTLEKVRGSTESGPQVRFDDLLVLRFFKRDNVDVNKTCSFSEHCK